MILSLGGRDMARIVSLRHLLVTLCDYSGTLGRRAVCVVDAQSRPAGEGPSLMPLGLNAEP